MAYGKIEAKDLVEIGLFRSEEEVLREGLRSLLIHHPEYRIKVAVVRYREEEISLGKAAETAGVSIEDMKEILRDRGVPLKGPETVEELLRDAEAAKKATE